MSEPLQPDRRAIITNRYGTYYVDLWRGLFRDEIRIHKDVWPALGGMISRAKHRHRDSEAQFDAAVKLVSGDQG